MHPSRQVTARSCRPRLKLENNVQGVDDTLIFVSSCFGHSRTIVEAYGNVTEDGQQDVDEEVGIASALEEHTQRREEDGEDDLDDVAGRR